MPSYSLTWGDPSDRLYDIALRFTAPYDQPRLLLPAWRPGRYLIANFAANVREWSAGEHRIAKEDTHLWRVDAAAGDEVTVRYRYYAGVLDGGSSFLDHGRAYFNGINLFMLVDGLRDEEHRLSIGAPADWLIETQLARADERTFTAPDFDALVDAPTICAERITRHTFHESGATFHLVLHGDEGIDTESYVEPVRAIAKTQAELMGGLPFGDYRFLYQFADRWHGVEHRRSCSITIPRTAMLGMQPGDEAHDRFLLFTSHELFHAWNVKRMKPERFTPYDYWRPTPTTLLWVMEGMTSYYGNLTLARGGLWSEEHYVGYLQRIVEGFEGIAAKSFVSLAQTSFDAWLTDAAYMHDMANASYSFYTKGEIVSALLDLTIRNVTDGAKSLDDVLHLLWQRYADRGMEEDAMERAVADVADVGDFFRRYVDGVEPLPYEELFATVGIAVEVSEKPDASLGVRLNGMTVSAALSGGAGASAGLLPGDELLALDETRLTSADALNSAMRALPLGGAAELLVARGGRLLRLSLQGRVDPRPSVALRITGANARRAEWLGRGEA